MQHPDVCIAGAGIIGLSLALELHRRGSRVTVLESGIPLAQASTAAAGMLAALDPHNPPKIKPLAQFSLSLYPLWLEYLEDLSGITVPFHTDSTLQAIPSTFSTLGDELSQRALATILPGLVPGAHRFSHLQERSLDPRQLAAALLAAVDATSIELRPQTPVRLVRTTATSVEVHTPTDALSASRFVDCTGAWAATLPPQPGLHVMPVKGQMLSVALPSSLPLGLVVRTEDFYIVPRTRGANAGRAIIGATVEDAGFDTAVHSADIIRLHELAAGLLPALAGAKVLESWAGLRPATPDHLPLLGPLQTGSQRFLATGHYRNGILLAPATAHVVAQLLYGEKPSVDVAAFSPNRALLGSERRYSDIRS
jgi:glycine oxidase